jgi:CheY-like chemotaxis protein
MATRGKNKLVAIVNDDELMCVALHGLLRAVGLPAQAFASAETFLESGQQHETACLIADIRMPGISGLELQAKLKAERCKIPTIFIYRPRRLRDADAGIEGGRSGVPDKTVRRRGPADSTFSLSSREVRQHRAILIRRFVQRSSSSFRPARRLIDETPVFSFGSTSSTPVPIELG